MSIDGLMEFLRAYPVVVPLVLFVITVGEGIVFTSPFVPATALCLGIGAIHKAADGAFLTIVAAATIGTVLGDLISYLLGRRYRDSIATWWPLNRHPTVLPRAVTFMRTWGVPGLIASKFLGPLRWFGPTVTGIMVMPFWYFISVTAFASLLWATVVLSPAYYGAKAAGL